MGDFKWKYAIPGVGMGLLAADKIGDGIKKANDRLVDRRIDQVSGAAEKYLTSLNDFTSGEQDAVKGSIGDIKSLYDVFEQQTNKSYLDTTEGKSFQSMIDERSRTNKDQLKNDVSMMNGTPEAYLAGLDQINKQEGSSLRDLVSGADQRRSQINNQKSGLLSMILSGNQNLLGAKTGQVNTAYGYGSNTVNSANAQFQQQMQNILNALQSAGNFAMEGGAKLGGLGI